ncbi:hypothetical protein V5799_003123 [Amblyomma americanum]|uniref:Secreted protein n=1 Tax=Amblyomma americanum TaxID=6943 RepID=A0AAQ4D9V6_AMBAM
MRTLVVIAALTFLVNSGYAQDTPPTTPVRPGRPPSDISPPRGIQPLPRPWPRPWPQPWPRPWPRPWPQPGPRPWPQPGPRPKPWPLPRPRPWPEHSPGIPLPKPIPRPEPMFSASTGDDRAAAPDIVAFPRPWPRPPGAPWPLPWPQPVPENIWPSVKDLPATIETARNEQPKARQTQFFVHVPNRPWIPTFPRPNWPPQPWVRG